MGVRHVRPLTSRRVAAICLGLGLVLFVGCGDFAAHGRVPDRHQRYCRRRWSSGALGRWNDIPSDFRLVVFGLRLPRIALGILVGAALATSGAGFQALLRNPLADPYVLGVSSGAALGAIISLIAAPLTPGGFRWRAFVGRGRDNCGGLFSGAARRATG